MFALVSQLPLLISPLAAPAPAPALGAPMMRDNVVATAVADGRFTQLVDLVVLAGLDGVLDGSANDQRWTVFAPTDDAFAALPPDLVAALLADTDLLTQVLTYHVLADGARATQVVGSTFLTTVNTQRLDVTVNGMNLQIDQANVIEGDILCTNGVIHVIDEVLIPNTLDLVETAVDAGTFMTLETALVATGLDQALAAPAGPFTVFAPDDMAFGTLPPGLVTRLLIPGNRNALSSILQYHVVPGRLYAEDVVAAGSLTTLLGQVLPVTVQGNDVFVDGVKIVATDIETTNGNIHVLEGVLIP